MTDGLMWLLVLLWLLQAGDPATLAIAMKAVAALVSRSGRC
jgi:hypothetical protein